MNFDWCSSHCLIVLHCFEVDSNIVFLWLVWTLNLLTVVIVVCVPLLKIDVLAEGLVVFRDNWQCLRILSLLPWNPLLSTQPTGLWLPWVNWIFYLYCLPSAGRSRFGVLVFFLLRFLMLSSYEHEISKKEFRRNCWFRRLLTEKISS